MPDPTTTTPAPAPQPVPPQAYVSAYGNNPDVLSINDPLALANFLPGPPPPEIIKIPTTPSWVYFAGGGLALYVLLKKGI